MEAWVFLHISSVMFPFSRRKTGEVKSLAQVHGEVMEMSSPLHHPRPDTFPGDPCPRPWDLWELRSSEPIAGSPPISQTKKLRPHGSTRVTEQGREPIWRDPRRRSLRYLSQGVVGCVEDKGFSARCELAGQLRGVQLPVAAGIQFPILVGALQEEVGGGGNTYPHDFHL